MARRRNALFDTALAALVVAASRLSRRRPSDELRLRPVDGSDLGAP